MAANKPYYNRTVSMRIEQIARWHEDRNLIEGSTDLAQFTKLLEEVYELRSHIDPDQKPDAQAIADDIGDIIVVLVNFMERHSLSMQDCLDQAWGDIKDRTGRMVDGVFVKD